MRQSLRLALTEQKEKKEERKKEVRCYLARKFATPHPKKESSKMFTVKQ
jgi:hypothetical protein